MTRLSAHFVSGEFDCKDGTPVPDYALEQLERWAVIWGEPLRDRFGAVRILSGFRTLAHNRRVGGAPGSWHLYAERVDPSGQRRGERGVAADVLPRLGRPVEWAVWARAHRIRHKQLSRATRGGIGLYVAGGFLHLDTGPLRDWNGP